MRSTLMQALVSLATNASFGFSYTNFAKLREYTPVNIIPQNTREYDKQIHKI